MTVYLHKDERWPDYELSVNPPPRGAEQFYPKVEVTEAFYARWQRLYAEYDDLMQEIADLEDAATGIAGER